MAPRVWLDSSFRMPFAISSSVRRMSWDELPTYAVERLRPQTPVDHPLANSIRAVLISLGGTPLDPPQIQPTLPWGVRWYPPKVFPRGPNSHRRGTRMGTRPRLRSRRNARTVRN